MARKFEWMPFYIDSGISIDGNTVIAVDLSKKSLQEAELIAAQELECDKPVLIDAYCYYGFGCSGDGERLRDYWIVFEPTKNSFPVAVFATPETYEQLKRWYQI